MRLPVSAFSATTELPNRLSPMRSPPQKSNVGEPVARNTMPRFVSTVRPPQTFVPPEYFHESGDHVSYPYSPGCGIVWKIHFCLPVRTSKPRTCPGAESRGPSPVVEPSISRSLNTTPGVVM